MPWLKSHANSEKATATVNSRLFREVFFDAEPERLHHSVTVSAPSTMASNPWLRLGLALASSDRNEDRHGTDVHKDLHTWLDFRSNWT